MTKVDAEPFLRWAGSKRQLLHELVKFWPDGNVRYVEPFVGSACFYFKISPSKALLGDINQSLVNTYDEIKNNVEAVVVELESLVKSEEDYYKIRSRNTEEMNHSEQAARFIYLNRFCFNGLYRTNRAGRFNVPYGGDRAGNLPTSESLRLCSTALRSATLIAGDFEAVLATVRPGDFVYMDPPFSVRERRTFNEYDPSSFDDVKLQRLRIWMESFTSANIPFLVSYAECDEANALSIGYNRKLVDVRRNIAGFANKRGVTHEMLIWNFRA